MMVGYNFLINIVFLIILMLHQYIFVFWLWGFLRGGGFESRSDQSGENRCGGKGGDSGPPGLPDPV